jgi:hypothetical protein
MYFFKCCMASLRGSDQASDRASYRGWEMAGRVVPRFQNGLYCNEEATVATNKLLYSCLSQRAYIQHL